MGEGEGPGVSEESRKWRKQLVGDTPGKRGERMLAASVLVLSRSWPGLRLEHV